MRSSAQTLEMIARGISNNGGGRLMVAFTDKKEWVCGLEWGREVPNSNMYAAAAYGVGTTAGEAVNAALDETGWETPKL